MLAGPSGTHHTDTAKIHLSVNGSLSDFDWRNFNMSRSDEEDGEGEKGAEAVSE